MTRTAAAGQTLIFDADDTLWENNVFYERVVDEFVEWVAHPTLDPAAVKRIVDDVEEANIRAHGYGSTVFLRSLGEAFTRLTERPVGADEERRLAQFGRVFAAEQMELLADVSDVLIELAGRHTLQLMTKGVPLEQQRKVDVSGLAHHFAAVDIVPVKEPDTYRDLVRRHGLDASRTWMIGNSPRSDILAARAAGLRAVFVPHPNTWAHEHADLDPADTGVLNLTRFGELTDHF